MRLPRVLLATAALLVVMLVNPLSESPTRISSAEARPGLPYSRSEAGEAVWMQAIAESQAVSTSGSTDGDSVHGSPSLGPDPGELWASIFAEGPNWPAVNHTADSGAEELLICVPWFGPRLDETGLVRDTRR